MRISAVDQSAGGQASRSPQGASLGGEDFLKLMLTQLQVQDPTEPMKNSELLQQFLAMANIQSLAEISGSNQQIMEHSAKLLGMNLLGREVTIFTAQTLVTGQVMGLRCDEGNVFLTIDGENYALSDVVALVQNR